MITSIRHRNGCGDSYNSKEKESTVSVFRTFRLLRVFKMISRPPQKLYNIKGQLLGIPLRITTKSLVILIFKKPFLFAAGGRSRCPRCGGSWSPFWSRWRTSGHRFPFPMPIPPIWAHITREKLYFWYMIALLFLFIFIFSVLGMQLFGGRLRGGIGAFSSVFDFCWRWCVRIWRFFTLWLSLDAVSDQDREKFDVNDALNLFWWFFFLNWILGFRVPVGCGEHFHRVDGWCA